MKPLSLRVRVFALLVIVVTVIAATVSAGAYLAIRNVYLGHIDRMLEIMARAALAELDEPQAAAKLARDIRVITRSPWKGTGTHFRLWLEGQSDDLASSMPKGTQKVRFLWDLPDSARPKPEGQRFLDLQQKKKHYRAIWVRPSSDRDDVNVVIAHPSSYEHRRLNELLLLLIGVTGGLILLTSLLVAPLVYLAIRPISQTAERITGITHQNLASHDLDHLRVPAELEPFVLAVSGLLSELDGVLDRYKQFTANAAHELRTPLALAESSLHLASEEALRPEEHRQAIIEALSDMERMGELIRQLLLLAEVDELGQVPEPADFALDAMLYELAAGFDRRAAQAGGHVVCDALAPVCVLGNEELIRQLFANLLDNAVKHGSPGRTVRLRLECSSDETCVAAVENEGGELSEASLSQLFDRFHRGESARRLKTHGSGLGLAIAFQIALLHGGEIWATTSPGRRTVFCVRLPCSLRGDDDRSSSGTSSEP